MLIPFYGNLLDETTGFQFIVDIETVIDADIEWDGGEPRLVCNRIYAVCQEPMESRKARATEADRYPRAAQAHVDMIARGGIWKQVGLELMVQAEASDQFFLDVLAAHDVVFCGHPNDPDAGYKVDGRWA